MPQGSALIVGAGDGLGAAIARAFTAEGLAVCLPRRPRHHAELQALATSIGANAHAFPVDAREEPALIALVDQIDSTIAPLEVVVFNIGANVMFPVTETTTRVY